MPTYNETVTKIIRPGELATDKLPVLSDGTVTYRYRIEAKHIEEGWVRVEFYDEHGKIQTPSTGSVKMWCSNNRRNQWLDFNRTGFNLSTTSGANTNANLYGPTARYVIPHFESPMSLIRVKASNVGLGSENVQLTNGTEGSTLTDIMFNLPAVVDYADRTKVRFYVLDGPDEEPAVGETPIIETTLGIIRALTATDGTQTANVGPNVNTTYFISSSNTNDRLYIGHDGNMSLYALYTDATGAAPADGTVKYLAMDLIPWVITTPASQTTKETTTPDTSFEWADDIRHEFTGTGATASFVDLGETVPSDSAKDGNIHVYVVARGANKPAQANRIGVFTLDQLRAWTATAVGDTTDLTNANGFVHTHTDPQGDAWNEYTLYIGRDASDPHKVLARFNGFAGTPGQAEIPGLPERDRNVDVSSNNNVIHKRGGQFNTRNRIIGYTAPGFGDINADLNLRDGVYQDLTIHGLRYTYHEDSSNGNHGRLQIRYTNSSSSNLTVSIAISNAAGDNYSAQWTFLANQTGALNTGHIVPTTNGDKERVARIFGGVGSPPYTVPDSARTNVRLTFTVRLPEVPFVPAVPPLPAIQRDLILDIESTTTITTTTTVTVPAVYGDGDPVEQIPPSGDGIDHMKIHVDTHGT